MGKTFRKVEGHNIFISNLKEASDKSIVRAPENNIKVIMTVCEKDCPHYPGIAQFKVKLSDPQKTLAPGNPIHEAVRVFKIARYLAAQREGNILIHCVSGHNRSAIVPALWLATEQTISEYLLHHPDDAFRECLKEAVKLTGVKDNKPWMKAFGYKWEE